MGWVKLLSKETITEFTPSFGEAFNSNCNHNQFVLEYASENQIQNHLSVPCHICVTDSLLGDAIYQPQNLW